MDTAFNVIVIILSAALFVLLVIAITATIFIVRLVRQLRNIAEKGSQIADKAEELTTTIVDGAKSHSFVKTLGGLISVIRKFK